MLTKDELLADPVEHLDPRLFDSRPILAAFGKTALQARNLARAAAILDEMLTSQCAVILTLAGSLVSAGLKEVLLTLVEHDMVDAIVSTGANMVDQDFFEGLGFRHYAAPGSVEAPRASDPALRELGIDRIYDTYIDEAELRECDQQLRRIFDALEATPHSSREVMDVLGAYLASSRPACRSILRVCHEKRVPVFVPALSDCSAGFGAVLHRTHRRGEPALSFDSARDFHELTLLKVNCGETGLLMLGGGVPKNFAQDVVVAAELIGEEAPMHRYAVQITVADSRDGALSGSTLREACSWGKVDVAREQMVFGEITTLLPLLVSDAYHRGSWKSRSGRRLAELFPPTATPWHLT